VEILTLTKLGYVFLVHNSCCLKLGCPYSEAFLIPLMCESENCERSCNSEVATEEIDDKLFAKKYPSGSITVCVFTILVLQVLVG